MADAGSGVARHRADRKRLPQGAGIEADEAARRSVRADMHVAGREGVLDDALVEADETADLPVRAGADHAARTGRARAAADVERAVAERDTVAMRRRLVSLDQ